MGELGKVIGLSSAHAVGGSQQSTGFHPSGGGLPGQGVIKSSALEPADVRSIPKTEVVTNRALSDADLNSALSTINNQLQSLHSNYLQFERDESSDRMVIYIKDNQTGEVIRQIPSENFLKIAENIDSYLSQLQDSFQLQSAAMPVGLITNEKA